MDKNTAKGIILAASDEDILDVVLGSGFDSYGWWGRSQVNPGIGITYVCETGEMINNRPTYVKALVTPGTIRKAWCALIDEDYFGIRAWQGAGDEDDLFDIDANEADCIMQRLVLGKVLFG